MKSKHTYELTLTGSDGTVPAVQRPEAFGLQCVAVSEIKTELENCTDAR